MYYNFNFVATVNTEPKEEIKEVGTKGAKKATVSFQVASENNKQYVQLEYWVDKEGKTPTQLKIQQLEENGTRVSKTIDFKNRNEDIYVKSAPDFAKKTIYDKTFITYDKDVAVEILNSVKKGDKVFISGDVKFEYNKKNGKVYQKFNIKDIKKPREDAKDNFKVNAEVYFDNTAIDSVQYSEGKITEQGLTDKIIPINCYVGQKNDYNDKDKVNYIPIPLVLNVSKLDPTKHENAISKLEIMLEDFELGQDSEQVKVIQINYEPINGAEQVSMSDEDFIESLPERLKKHVLAEIRTIEDAKLTMGITKENIQEIRFKGFTLNSKYKEGALDTEITKEKLLEYISMDTTQPQIETKPNIVDDSMSSDDDLEDLL